MSYTPSYNPDVVPSVPVRRGLIYGAKCPISHVEFLNLTEVGDPAREQVDPSKTMDELVAAQKLATWTIICEQDASTGPRNLSVEDRRRLYLAEQE